MKIALLGLILSTVSIVFLSFTLVLVNVFGGSSLASSEEIEIINQSNTDAVKFKIVLANPSGSVAIVYDYKDADKRFYLDFKIVTDKEPLGLEGVFLNNTAIDWEVLLASNDQLKFEGDRYILSFDDSISQTGFLVNFDPRDGYLKLAEFAKGDGIKFCVKCVQIRTGVALNIPFNISVEGARKFFDLIEQYGENVEGFLS
ncbi:hypothetical protein [Borrelia sp. P9F1]|uniref:hypothetical protein n=1 Tax=Borrelia sp. P9F1 TaxID=3058374 RepID=UPI00264954EE|nr:hypothetical protein [Borrelia sp. P9F1]WKC58676.1 hypothetical protein QYZ68_05590 [Borrelia sp. P9F1]